VRAAGSPLQVWPRRLLDGCCTSSGTRSARGSFPPTSPTTGVRQRVFPRITAASLMAMLAAGLLADSLGVVSLLRIAGAVLVVAAGYGFWVFRGAARGGERGVGWGGRGLGVGPGPEEGSGYPCRKLPCAAHASHPDGGGGLEWRARRGENRPGSGEGEGHRTPGLPSVGDHPAHPGRRASQRESHR